MHTHRYEFKKLGTSIEICIYDDELKKDIINKSIEIIVQWLNDYEKNFSRFIQDSQLNQLNKNGRIQATNDFINMINISKYVNKITNGYFNPLIDLEKIGYSKSFETGIFEIPKNNGNHLNINIDEIIISGGNQIIISKDMKLDLGGIAKGYAVDKISDMISKSGFPFFYVNAGGDIFCSSKNNESWIIGIDDPFDDGILGNIGIKDCSVSTSGIYKRKWSIQGEEYNHILNPFDLKNNNEIQSVSLICNKCYLSDTIATALIAMGKDKSINLLKKNNLDAIIITKEKEAILSQNILYKYNFELSKNFNTQIY